MEPTLFNSDYFNTLLCTRWLSQKYLILREVNSTNSYLKARTDKPEDGFLVLAESQFNGRGQHRRMWLSDPGKNLTFSFYFKPVLPKRLHSLTIVVAHSCAKALSRITNKNIQVKWPNDLIYDGKKVGGILVESELIGDMVEKLIIGIGVNVNQRNFDPKIPSASSLINLSDNEMEFSRESILASLCIELENDLDKWNSNLPLERELIHSSLIGYGKYGKVEVNGNLTTERTKFAGICNQGFPTFVNHAGEITKYRHEQIRFFPDNPIEDNLINDVQNP